MHKAPFSIFLSADMKYPMKIYKLNLSLTKPKVYARGGIVLFSKKDISLLDAKKIAIANPRVAPYGKAAVEAFKSMNIYDKIKNKLVFAPTVSSVALYVDRGVDIGVIAKSMQVNGREFMRNVSIEQEKSELAQQQEKLDKEKKVNQDKKYK